MQRLTKRCYEWFIYKRTPLLLRWKQNLVAMSVSTDYFLFDTFFDKNTGLKQLWKKLTDSFPAA